MKYETREESGATQIVEADSIQDAIERSEEWVADGSYDQRVMVRFSVYEIGEDGEPVEDGESYTGEVEAGPQPKVPECADGSSAHDWQSPHALVGGLEENPGVYKSGTREIYTHQYVCGLCGARRTDRNVTVDRNPGELAETVEYGPADERSLAWVEAR